MADYHTPPLIPPFRFNVVESNVFRGGYPKERNLRFMKRLQLKTWISLIPDPPAEHLTTFCEQENINLVHFKVAKPKEGVTLSFSRATRVLQLLVDVDNLPAYIHCLDGTSVTGLVIACLRRLQLWDLRCAMAEYCRFVSPESDEKAFVERFHGDMLIQDRILPAWLWNGGQLALERHPSLPKLRFERVERERETRAQAAKEAKEAAKEAMRRRINGSFEWTTINDRLLTYFSK
ncbi:tyrosine phosphatase family-domain-containing protein [Syncephalis fuscata]|nr:tyrosine phosphatase family-domain-containing protein [Syncephalis fuscata]